MARYGAASTKGTHAKDANNLTLLRADVHKCFDDFDWTIAPKPSKTPNTDGSTRYKLVFHLIGDQEELGRFFHNKELHNLQDVSIEYLFAVVDDD